MIHAYRKRQTSDLKLRISQNRKKQIKTFPNVSYG